MSKKMLKRSLALGALMAFVITGSAMAAELTIEYDGENYTATGTGIEGSLEKDNVDAIYSELTSISLAGSYGPEGSTKKVIGSFNTATNDNVIIVDGGSYTGSHRIYGAYSDSSNSNNNTVKVSNVNQVASNAVLAVIGGWAQNDANGNTVTIDKVYTNFFVYGGDAQCGNSNNNTVTIKNSTVGYVNGGFARFTGDTDDDGIEIAGNTKDKAENDSNYNNVTIENSTVLNSVQGGAAGGYGDAVGNTVTVTNLQFTNASAGGGGALESGYTEAGNAENNTLIINGENTEIVVQTFGGRAQDSGNAIGNEVTINAGKFTNTGKGIVGGITENMGSEFQNGTEGDALRNSVTINGGTINTKVYGGYSEKGVANENTVTIAGGTINNRVYGGYGATEANGNTVNISGGTFADDSKIYGGMTKTGGANNNNIVLTGTKIPMQVVGGWSDDGEANNNVIKLEKVYGSAAVFTGVSTNADAVGNTLEIILGDKDLDLKGPKALDSYGGNSLNGDAVGNEIIISAEGNGKLTGRFYGGASEGTESDAIENRIIVNSGVVEGVTMYAGYAVEKSGDATKNELIIKGGNVTSNTAKDYAIVAGKSYHKKANENILTLEGGTVAGHFYGGYGYTEANNNTVNISGEVDVANANVYGGYAKNSSEFTGNTLNIGDGWSDKIQSVQNFNTVNFGKDSSVTTNVTLGTGATINLADGDAYTGKNYAIDGKLTTLDNDSATLTIGNIKANTYNIASEYAGTENWELKNDLMNVKEWNTKGQLQVTVEAKPVDEIAGNLGVSQGTASLVEDIISNPEANAEAVQFVENVMNSGVSKEAAQEAYAAMEKMAEAGGQSATAARIINNVTGVTNDRLSFNCGHSAPHKGGHGVGLFEEGSGADIWVEYVHGKDKVEDMKSSNGASSYEGQYNGFVMGVDFKKVNKFQSGIAFNYGEGDTNSVGSSARTHSDYDFWGVGYYGNIHNDDSNIIFDINYAKTDSDVTQNSAGGTLEASPETATLSAGVKVEKLYQNENVQIVPYTGLRFMSIDTDDYATKGGGFMYNMERQNIWLLPVGVSIKQEVVNDNGWTVSPRVDLSYIWAFGDTNSNMEVKSGNGISPIWYDVMDDGSFLGLVGIEAHKGRWGYGVAYSYQKGDHSESKKWFIDANYSF